MTDTPAAPTTPLWDELIMHALASDGPIRDSDVKEAVRYYRPKIEAAIAAQAVQIGFREGASQVAFDRDEKARSTPAEARASTPLPHEPGGRRNPTFETECEMCGARLRITNNYSPMGDFLDQSIEAVARSVPQDEPEELRAAAQAIADYSWGLHLAGTPNEDEAIDLIEALRAALAAPAEPRIDVERLGEIRSIIERARFLANTPGRRIEADRWLGDAINRLARLGAGREEAT